MRFVDINLMPWTEGTEATADRPVAHRRHDLMRGRGAGVLVNRGDRVGGIFAARGPM